MQVRSLRFFVYPVVVAGALVGSRDFNADQTPRTLAVKMSQLVNFKRISM